MSSTCDHNILCLYAAGYFESKLGRQTPSQVTSQSGGPFKAVFKQFLSWQTLSAIFRAGGRARRRPPKLSAYELIMGLVFHCLQGGGTLPESIQMVTGKRLAKSSLSERRQNLPWELFLSVMKAALRPKAQADQQTQAFDKGWRLVAMDGTQSSVSNTPRFWPA